MASNCRPLARATDAGLAISLSAPTDELRSQIMPINRKYPLAELKRALLAYPLPRGLISAGKCWARPAGQRAAPPRSIKITARPKLFL